MSGLVRLRPEEPSLTLDTPGERFAPPGSLHVLLFSCLGPKSKANTMSDVLPTRESRLLHQDRWDPSSSSDVPMSIPSTHLSLLSALGEENHREDA
jgi:hypothetical protein